MDVPLRLYPRKFHLDRATVARHIARYLKAVTLIPDELHHFVDESHWLDYGCGSGYGTALLANFARRVDGYDHDREAIKYAIDHGSAAGVRYIDSIRQHECYEAVFMIEVAEHMAQEQFQPLLGALASFHLSDGGVIIVTTPIVEETGPSKTNPHHKCEYTVEDFKQVVKEACLEVRSLLIQSVESTAGEMKQGFFVLGN